MGPRLTTISACGRQPADGPAGLERIGGAAGDVNLLLGADDHVAERQHRLQMLGDAVRGDEALLAEAVPGEAPEHRPVVDIEDDACAPLALPMRTAFLLMASRLGRERWVPEISTARERRI